MTVTVNTVSAEGFRHSVDIDEHELFADIPTSAGGEGSAPEPHDYFGAGANHERSCLLYTSPSPRDRQKSRMPSSA